MLTAGNYKGIIVRHECGFSEKKGTPGITFFFSVTHKKNAKGEYEQIDNVERNFTWWITDNTAEYVMPKLAKLGCTAEDLGRLDPDECSDPMDFSGLEIEVYCKLERYTKDNGEEREAERWDLSTGGNSGPKMQKKSGFSAMLSSYQNQLPSQAKSDDAVSAQMNAEAEEVFS